jgi:hypothetical protein
MRARVNYDDRRWMHLSDRGYAVDIRQTQFPGSRQGERNVSFKLIEVSNAISAAHALTLISRQGLRRPDRAETEVFLESFPAVITGRRLVSLCGVVGHRDGIATVAYIQRSSTGDVSYECVWSNWCWESGTLFLAVAPIAKS